MTSKQLAHHQHQPAKNKFPLALFAHDVELRTNVGSLFRLADALGVETLYLSGKTPIPPNEKIRRSSRATEKYVDFRHAVDALDTIKKLRADGFHIVGLEITDASTDLRDFRFNVAGKTCLLVGSEKNGIAEELLQNCDACLHIPMFGRNSSMNLANATAIALFEYIRQSTALEKKGPTGPISK